MREKSVNNSLLQYYLFISVVTYATTDAAAMGVMMGVI